MADHHHLSQRGVLAFRVQLLNGGCQCITKFSSGNDKGISTAINEIPELTASAQFRIGCQRINHLGPRNRARKRPMYKNNGHAARKVRLSQYQLASHVCARAEELDPPQTPDI